MAERKVIGKRIVRVDALDKVTGRATFGADVYLPGMLYGKTLRSPYAHARIKRIDYSRALALEGVKAVITGQDLPPLQEVSTGRGGGEQRVDIVDIAAKVMARDKVLHVGHPVAAVAATSLHIAEAAIKLIEVEYEVLPPVFDPLESMKPDAPLLHNDLYTQTLGEKPSKPSNIGKHIELGRGDVEAGFAEADVILEHTYRTQIVHQNYIEPQASVAKAESDGKVTVWTSTQGSFAAKNNLMRILKLPSSKLRVIPTEIGGGFGGKVNVLLEPLCVALARKAGRPVKMVLTRAEVLEASGPGSAAVITVKAGAKKDGRLTAVQVNMVYNAGAFPGAPIDRATLTGIAPYKVANLKIDGYDVVTNKPHVTAYRAPGSTQAAFAVENHMDKLAEAIGIDPLEFRAKNAVEEGDLMPTELPFNRIGLKEILARVKRHPAWTGKLDGENVGRGLALGFWPGGTFTSSCHVIVNADSSLNLVLGAVDVTGTNTSMTQIAADEFGISPEEVTAIVGDTDTVAYTDVSAGSRITYTMSIAVHRACQEALAEVKRRIAPQLEASADDIEYSDLTFRVKGEPDKAMSLRDAVRAASRGGPIMGRGTATRMQQAPQFSAHIADVQVDPETGKVKLLRYTAFHDVGCAVNPTEVEGQIHGGVAQGIGWALTEEYIYDQKGVLLNPSLLDYRTPVALDLPMIDTELIEVPASDGPYGIRGIGECPIVAPPATIANAIYRAIGVRLKELPMNPERVFWAIKAKEREKVAASP